jgi:hypothetical protein
MYHRFVRYRSLKTKAKLIDRLRRRGKWDWDATQRPYFTPRHVRYASQDAGRSTDRWQEQDELDARKTRESSQDNGFELSEREKEWKGQMEAMRERIERDPYEAVFGKRFEPFWSPLFANWNNVGQASSSASGDAARSNSNVESAQTVYKPLEPEPTRKHAEPDGELPDGQLTNYAYTAKKNVVEPDSDTPNGQPTTYSYGASSPWDSWTKKTSRVEWDSVSGQKRRFEYDPISNRMVQIQPESEVKMVESAIKEKQHGSNSPLMSHGWKAGLKPSPSASTMIDNALKPTGDAPSTHESRKAIAVPTLSNDGNKTSTYFQSLLNTATSQQPPNSRVAGRKHEKYPDHLTADDVRASVGRSNANRRPVEGEEDRETLSRDLLHVTRKRLQLLKQESDSSHTRIITKEQRSRLDQQAVELNARLDALDAAQTKRDAPAQQEQYPNHPANKPSVAERRPAAELETRRVVVERRETSRAREQLQKLLANKSGVDDMRIQSVVREEQQPQEHLPEELTIKSKVEDSIPKSALEETGKLEEQPAKRIDDSMVTSMTRMTRFTPTVKTHEPSTNALSQAKLQPAVDRMQSKPSPVAEDPDDSAAHESTGDFVDYGITTVPKNWEKQADILQGDRVRRMGSSSFATPTLEDHTVHLCDEINQDLSQAPRVSIAEADEDMLRASATRMSDVLGVRSSAEDRVRNEVLGAKSGIKRWMSALNNRRAEYEAKLAREKTAKSPQDAEKDVRAARATALLQAEISDQKSRMHAHEHHIGEGVLQPTERDNLQSKDLSTTHKLNDLDTAFKQMNLNTSMHVDRIKDLERKLADNRMSEAQSLEKEKYLGKIKALREELELAYKQSSLNSEMHLDRISKLEQALKPKAMAMAETNQLAEGDLSPAAVGFAKKDSSKWYKQKASANARGLQDLNQDPDQQLMREVRDIYERAYGTIDVHHRQSRTQPQKDVGLEAALAGHEKKQNYGFRKDNLEAELAQQKSREAQTTGTVAHLSMPRQAVIDDRGMDQDVHGARNLDAGRPDLIGSGQNTAAPVEVQWEEPPVYKILAYDSGNDTFSTATTSSNFTNNETPVSIQAALSQLYQPARFVSHFADLQKDGFQVIHGTKDLLLFKKVKNSPADALADGFALKDHSLVRLSKDQKPDNPTNQTAYINPIDGMAPETGSFASPTGFVGDRWDDTHSAKGLAQPSRTASQAGQPDAALRSALEGYESEKDVQYRHSPRVRRQEHVFSGQHRANTAGSSKQGTRDESSPRSSKELQQKWKSWRSGFKWAVLGIGASTVAYGIGAATERRKETDRDRWRRIQEASRRHEGARWDLGQGRWS